MSTLSGKVALVTGGSRGIGRAIAIKLAQEGATVIINYSKDTNGAKNTVETIENRNGYCKEIKMDISKANNCFQLITEVISKFGKIDILINNAGKSKVGLLVDSSLEDIDEIISTNLLSAIYLSKYSIEDMIKRKSGVIINISSIWGESGASCEVIYSTTKGGLNILTKSLAKEVAGWGIRVNGVAPGVINTEMNNCFTDDEMENLISEIPMGRLGETNEVAEIVAFLCNDKCKYINGEIIKVDGGFL